MLAVAGCISYSEVTKKANIKIEPLKILKSIKYNENVFISYLCQKYRNMS